MSNYYWYTNFTDGYTGWSLYGQEMTHNAENIFDILHKSNVTRNAAAAICGNFTWESGLNTGQWQHGMNMIPESGFGLGQWTPSTKFSDYIGSTAMEDMCNGLSQIEFLLYDTAQWSTYYVDLNTGYSAYYEIYVPIYPTMEDFLRAEDDLGGMAAAWMVYWERPNALYQHLQERQDYADYWYNNIKWKLPAWLIARAAQQWRY